MHQRKHRCLPCLLLGLALGTTLFCVSLWADSIEIPNLEKSSKRLLHRAVGDLDPASPIHLAARLGPEQMTAAFYHGTRVERLIALDAAASCRDNAFYLAPSLIALMGAADRQVASLAARALNHIVFAAVGRPDGFDSMVPKQAGQLIAQLENVAEDARIDVDIRHIAVVAIAPLRQVSGENVDEWALSLLNDEALLIRRQALGLLSLPLSKPAVSSIVKAATADSSLEIRGEAVAMLCENALAHGVMSPSEDLSTLMGTTLQTPKMPVDAMGGILACLSELEGEKRDALVQQAIAHPDPSVKQYWKSLKAK